jgi:hypothetical protein
MMMMNMCKSVKVLQFSVSFNLNTRVFDTKCTDFTWYSENITSSSHIGFSSIKIRIKLHLDIDSVSMIYQDMIL